MRISDWSSYVCSSDLLVRDLEGEGRQLPLLAVGVEAHRHRGAGGERGGEQFIGRRPGPAAADLDRLVGHETDAANRDLGLEATPAGGASDDARVGGLKIGRA